MESQISAFSECLIKEHNLSVDGPSLDESNKIDTSYIDHNYDVESNTETYETPQPKVDVVYPKEMQPLIKTCASNFYLKRRHFFLPLFYLLVTVSAYIFLGFPFILEVAECAPGEGSSTSDYQPDEWRLALESLPDSAPAPGCVLAHIQYELVALVNIGRKKAVFPHSGVFKELVEPLALEDSTIGFARFFLDRVRELQLEHSNRGHHILFALNKQRKERLYSCLWEYARELERNR